MPEWLKKYYKHILAFGIAAGFLFVTWWKMGIFYQTNDDRYMAELLSGAATGKVETHLIYINYFLSLPLSWLYRILPMVPWYGGFLLLLLGSAVFVLFDSALSKAEKWTEVAGVLVCAGILYLLQMYLFAQIQYTCVAALVALAGFSAILLYRNRKVGFVVFVVLELLAYLLRSQAMLMVALPGLTILVSVAFAEYFSDFRKKKSDEVKFTCKEMLKKVLILAGTMVFVLFVGFVGNLIGYSGKDWKEFQEFNDARTVLFDYYEMPAYEEVEHILDKYDVDAIEYEAVSTYLILGWDVSPECMSELAEYVKAKPEETEDVSAKIAEVTEVIRELLLEGGYWNIGSVLIVLGIGAFVIALLPGNRKMLLPLAGVLSVSYAVLFYLIWRGRYPLHVVLPFLVCVIYFLLMLVWYFFRNSEEKMQKYSYSAILIILLVVCGFKSYTIGQEQYRDIKELHRNETIYIQGLKDITVYCNERENQRFLIDIFAMMYYNGEVLDTDLYGEKNYRLTGSWFANTPYYLESLEEYFSAADGENVQGESKDGIYLIMYSAEGVMESPVVAYLAEKTGSEARVVDTFTAAHGGSYEVICFGGVLGRE